MLLLLRLKIGIPVLLFNSIFLGIMIVLTPNLSRAEELLPIEEQLMNLSPLDQSAPKHLASYLSSPPSSAPNKVKVLVKIFDTLVTDYTQNQRQTLGTYHDLQNLLRTILKELLPLADFMSGEQIKKIFLIAESDLVLSEALEATFNKFIETIENSPFDRESLPVELKRPRAVVINEMVRETLTRRLSEDHLKFHGQEEVYQQLFKTWIRPHGSIPVIVEPHFSGKTEFLIDLTRRIMLRDYPPGPIFQKVLKNALVIHINGVNMDSNPVLPLLETINNLQYTARRPIIVVIENIQSLPNDSVIDIFNSIRTPKNRNIKFIFTTTPKGIEKLKGIVGPDHAQETFQELRFQPLSPEDFIRVSHRLANDKSLTEQLGVQFTPKAIEKLARYILATKISEPSLMMQMRTHLENVAVNRLADDPFNDTPITERHVQSYIGQLTGIPFSPQDPKSITTYYSDLELKISEEIAGQEDMIREALELHRDLMLNSNPQRKVRVLGITGPTGVGKTELVKVLARMAYKSEKTSLRIEGTAFMSKENLWKLFGPTIGYKDSDQKGQLIEYLDGAGKNGGIILIDEGEKACPEFWQAMMSLFEDGFIVGGDGKPRFVNNHLIVITSNRGDRTLYPKGFETWPEEQRKAHLRSFKQDQLKALFTQTTGEKNETLFPDFVIQRIDRFVAANQANLNVALSFAPRLVKRIVENIYETNGKILKVSDQLVEEFVRANFNARAGYRPLFRSLEFNLKRFVYAAFGKMGAGDTDIRLNYVLTEEGKEIEAHFSESAPAMRFDFPTSSDDNLFRDPQIFERLKNLPDLIKSNIIGQDHIIEPLVAAVQKHILKSQGVRQSPLAFFNIGPTGTGKTELAKVLALALLGSKDRVGIIPMGDINTRAKWGNYFGGDVGHIGSDVMREFELILRANPQGGVIVLDEASNVGGDDKALKTELLKLLYNMLEEGKWISPTTGIEYNLSRYVFLLTGNDGQELYQGASDENLRESTWARNNRPERIMEILEKAGVPPPLLGRMAGLFWARPLNKAEMTTVAKKFLAAFRQEMEERQIKLSYNAQFIDELIAHSYSVLMGARSVRNFVENAVGGLIAQIEIRAFTQKLSLAGSTIALSFGDSKPRLPVISPQKKSQPDIQIHGEVLPAQGEGFQQALNVKGFLAPHNAQTTPQAYSTAIHEAGHAVTNDFANVGRKILAISIDSSGGHLGYVLYDENPHIRWTRQQVIRRIASLLAGGQAQKMAGLEVDSGWSSDIKTARILATEAVVHWGLGKDLASLFYPQDNEGKPEMNKEVLDREVEQLMREGFELSKNTLQANWKFLLLTAKTLMKKYTLHQKDWEQLKQERLRGKAEFERVTVGDSDRMMPVKPARRDRPALNQCLRALDGN